MKYKKYLLVEDKSTDMAKKAKKEMDAMGIKIWDAMEETKVMLSVEYDYDNYHKNPMDDTKTLNEAIKKIAKIYGVHPSWVEYDESVPWFSISFEKKIKL